MVVISKPCSASLSWTCEPTTESDLLENSIFKPLHILSGRDYFAQPTVKADGEYSFQINTLTVNNLHLTCWNQTDFSGSVLYNGGQPFSNNYTYLATFRSCRWEGFITGLASGDLEFNIAGDSNAKFWIKHDSKPVINYTCCNTSRYRIRIARELYYYMRLDLYHSTNTLNTILNYKILNNGTVENIAIANMRQPMRLNMGIITGTPRFTYAIESNTPESNFYYCPLICTSCLFSFAGTNCTACINDAVLIDNECRCETYKIYNFRTDRCESIPSLSFSCAFSSDSVICDSCVQNASIFDKYCECAPGYYEDRTTNSCKPNSYELELTFNKTAQYNYVDTLLEISNPCSTINGITCEETSSMKMLGTRKLIKFTDSLSSISARYDISGSSSYTISILNLRSGSFNLETFPSSNWTGIPVNATSPLAVSIQGSINKSYRLQGYLKFTEDRIHTFSVSTNTSCKLYFDFHQNPWEIPETRSDRTFHIVANKYYYLRIDFLGIPSGTLRMNFTVRIDNINLNLEGDKLYYVDSSNISRWDIHSSASNIYTPSYNYGLRFCPILCTSCYIKLTKTALDYNEMCDACIENAETTTKGKCICSTGYYQEANPEKCTKCPNTCTSCGLNSGILKCYSCIDNGIVNSGECLCRVGYYLNTTTDVSCSKCPDTCRECSFSNGVVICNSCIDNATVVLGKCVCNSGYYLDITSSAQCRKCPSACSTCYELDDNVICESCIEHAKKEQNDCKCEDRYFLSTALPIACYKIGDYCTNSELVNDEIVCTSCIDNASVIENICVCNDMYYGDTTETDVCLKCPIPCNKCKKSFSKIICESCISGYYISYIDPGICIECPPYCSECNEIEGQAICNRCLDMLILLNNECICEAGYGIDTSSITCKKCPELSYRCQYNNNSITYSICKENTFKLENNCYCKRDYYNNSVCTEFDCKIDIIIEYSYQPTVLNIIEDCSYDDKLMCESPYMSQTQVYGKESLSLIHDKDYYLYIIGLEKGGLSLNYWNSSDLTAGPSIYRKEDLNYDLSEYQEGIVRYEGFISLPLTGMIEFIIDTNTDTHIYLQDDRNILNHYSSIEFKGYFTEGEYYFIRIELSIVSNSYIKLYGYSYELSFDVLSDLLYYPNILANSPKFIPSSYCKQGEPSHPLVDSSNEDECPTLCNKCEESNMEYKNVICSECKDPEYSPGSMCICKNGFVHNIENGSCYIPYCSAYNDDEICLECLDYFTLKDGSCICEGDDFEMLNDLCTPKEFRVMIESDTNKIGLLFSKYLQYNLNQDDLTINIQDSQISKLASYEFRTTIERLSYSIEFKYPNTIDTQIFILLSLSPNIIDREAAHLSASSYNITLHLLSKDSNSDTAQELTDTIPQVNEYSEASLASTAAVASATAVLSLTNLNPNLLISMLSTLQIFSLIPLMNIKLSNRIKGVCSGFDVISISPNIMKYLVTNQGKEINERYSDHGYTTSQFLINSEEQITILITICCLFIGFKLTNRLIFRSLKDCRVKRIASRIEGSFEFGTFISFIIQGYLEFFITSGLNILYLEYSSPYQILNLAGACATFVRYM